MICGLKYVKTNLLILDYWLVTICVSLCTFISLHTSEARAFIELISYIEGSVEDGIFTFKFADLRKLYEKRLEDLGLQIKVNKDSFKEQIFDYYPDA